jgi:uncharacterized protein (DUF983 family)
MNDKFKDRPINDIKWECPNCKEHNIDDKDLTARPLCARCLRDYSWDEIKEIHS